jgi:predicted house-cleaning noncanonical NTP pyrophosphatase (MazG superfamily)
MVEYDKLVRDRIPEIIRAAGKIPVTRTVADAEEMKRRLLDKLAEEMQ